MPKASPSYEHIEEAVGFRFPIKTALLAGVGLFAAATVLGSYFTIGQTERGVVTRAGAFSYIADPGMHFKLPFFDTVHKYDVDMQQFTTGRLNTYTVDNQEVDATLTVQWQIPVDQLAYIYTNTPAPDQNLQAMVIDRFKIEAGKINVTEFANKRGELVKKLTENVASEANRLYHLRVTDVQLPNLDYQESFRTAQANAAVVKTQIEQAEGLKLKADKEAETAKAVAAGQANAAIEAARGRAEAVRQEADAAAHAIQIKGEAEANAQRLMADALSQNASLVEYMKATRWDGKLPEAVYASAPIPYLSIPPTAK